VEEPNTDDPDQIRWAWVGHNSSHQYYLGVDSNDRVWQRTFGEEFDQAAYESAGGFAAEEAGIISPYSYVDCRYSESCLVGNWEDVRHIGHW
jgi:hypothetical protein